MGEFTLSGNGNIGISSTVEFSTSVNSTKSNSIFYTTPTTVSETSNLLQASQCNAMQDEIIEKSPNVSDNDTISATTTSISSTDKTTNNAQLNVVVKECDTSGLSTTPNNLTGDCTNKLTGSGSNAPGDSVSVQPSSIPVPVPQSTTVVPNKTNNTLQLGSVFNVTTDTSGSNVLSSSTSVAAAGAGGGSTPALWSTNTIDDTYMHSVQSSVNGGGGGGGTGTGGGLSFQNFVSYNNVNAAVVAGNQAVSGRRAITASHNFSHTAAVAATAAMGRQQMQPNHSTMYKGYSGWPQPQQQQPQSQQQHQQPTQSQQQPQQPSQSQQQNTWSTGGAASAAAAWNRGRSVPNLNPMQQIGGLMNRKPSPTFSHQHSNMIISPVKFRRSTSYPGKGIFTQPPTFEITNMDDNRELLPYQFLMLAPAQSVMFF